MNMDIITGFLHKGSKIVADNAPVILTGVGVVGTAATAYLAANAGFKSSQVLADAKFAKAVSGETTVVKPAAALSKKETVEKVWKLYLPAVGVGTLTIAAIIFSNRISTKRAAALAAAFTIVQQNHEEYKDKVQELFGSNKAEKVDAAVAQAKVDANPIAHIHKTAGGDSLYLEPYTGRYFYSDHQSIKESVNNLNYRLLRDGAVSMNDFFDVIGLDRTVLGDELGWNRDNLIEVEMPVTTVTDDDKACFVLNYKVDANRNWFRFAK